VPLNTAVTYDDTKPFAQALAQLMERHHPKLIVSSMKKSLRGGKVLIDWSQNSFHKTTVAVYSLRARERPTVSTPVTWDEIADDRLDLVFDTTAVLERIDEHGDLFAAALEKKQKLPRS
jgi:bifunctional non-homologous end joining protein LigD